MSQIDLYDLLAEPSEPSIRVRVTPDQSVEISQIRWQNRMPEILSFCVDLDVEDKLSWQLLQAVTNGDGDMAKLLIALGEMLHAWTRHPSIDFPELWTHQGLPMILSGSSYGSSKGIPKPSRGDLEAGMIACQCCRRMMGPPDSAYHDLVAAIMDPRLCIDCEVTDCTPGGTCRWKENAPPKVEKIQEEEKAAEESQVADEMSAYEDLFKM